MRIERENVTRKIDSLGRVSIPKALRDKYYLEAGNSVNFYVIEDDDGNQYVSIKIGS